MADRNIELSRTLPGESRGSYVRCTSGARPLSMPLAIDAALVRQFADDVEAGVLPQGRLADQLRMLAGRLERLEASASGLEDAASVAMGTAR